MENINVKEFKEKIESDSDAVIIDVRTPEEEVEGLIPNSINMNIMEADFPDKIKALDKTKTYYVYCRSGRRSNTACQLMDQQGLRSYNLLGGIQEWNQKA